MLVVTLRPAAIPCQQGLGLLDAFGPAPGAIVQVRPDQPGERDVAVVAGGECLGLEGTRSLGETVVAGVDGRDQAGQRVGEVIRRLDPRGEIAHLPPPAAT
jgi:hypothetical protein